MAGNEEWSQRYDTFCEKEITTQVQRFTVHSLNLNPLKEFIDQFKYQRYEL